MWVGEYAPDKATGKGSPWHVHVQAIVQERAQFVGLEGLSDLRPAAKGIGVEWTCGVGR